jgi:hypothetical protein
VDRPEHGELLMARDVLLTVGYSPSVKAYALLGQVGVPLSEQRRITGSKVTNGILSFPNRGAIFLTRKGVNLLLMASTMPQAQEFRNWLAGDVVPAIADTGRLGNPRLQSHQAERIGATLGAREGISTHPRSYSPAPGVTHHPVLDCARACVPPSLFSLPPLRPSLSHHRTPHDHTRTPPLV